MRTVTRDVMRDSRRESEDDRGARAVGSSEARSPARRLAAGRADRRSLGGGVGRRPRRRGLLEVSRSGFYDWQTHVPSAGELQDRVLAREIELIYDCSGRTYGVPRMTHWLRQQGFEVNPKRVGRIMRELGLEGESGRRRVKTTIVDKRATADRRSRSPGLHPARSERRVVR